VGGWVYQTPEVIKRARLLLLLPPGVLLQIAALDTPLAKLVDEIAAPGNGLVLVMGKGGVPHPQILSPNFKPLTNKCKSLKASIDKCIWENLRAF